MHALAKMAGLEVVVTQEVLLLHTHSSQNLLERHCFNLLMNSTTEITLNWLFLLIIAAFTVRALIPSV